MSLPKELRKLHAGGQTFEQFCRATEQDWKRMALYLLRRWQAPAGVEAEDVAQELRLATWTLMANWDPERAPLDKFVTWNATAAAKKWLHRQRNAYRRDDKQPARFPLSFSSLSRNEEGEVLGTEIPVEAQQHETVEHREALARVLQGLSYADEQAFLALLLEDGDVEAAGRRLCNNVHTSLALQIGSEAHAQRIVRRAAARAAEQAGLSVMTDNRI